MLFHFTDDTYVHQTFSLSMKMRRIRPSNACRIYVFSSIVLYLCSNTDSSFLGVQLVLFLMDEFFLTFITGVIFNSSRYLSCHLNHMPRQPILFEYCCS